MLSWKKSFARAGRNFDAKVATTVRERNDHYERIEQQQSIEYHDPSEFDRIAFAMRALRRLKPKRVKVAVYSATSGLRVEQGRNLYHGEGGGWAIVGIPPYASREHIAYALAELAGVESVPYAVQALLAAERDGSA